MPLTWPDGTREEVVGFCPDSDLGVREYGERLKPVVDAGFFVEGGFPFAYVGSFLWEVEPGLFLMADGDVDEFLSPHYLRGNVLEAVAQWEHQTSLSHLPYRELVLAADAGMLDRVEDYEESYPVSLFDDEPAFEGAFFNCDLILPADVRAGLIAEWSVGSTLIAAARRGQEPELATWQARLARFASDNAD